jgi:hypothetical protein
MTKRTGEAGTRSRVVAAVAVAGLLAAAGCGDDDGDDANAPDEPTTTAASGDGAVTIDDVELRCGELSDIATDLRGEAPESAEASGSPPGPVDVTVDGEVVYETAGCVYAYEGNTFQDPNRVTLQINRAVVDTPEARDAIFDSLAFDTEIPDLGDAARYSNRTTIDALSLVHVRVGDSVITVRVAVPGELENEPYLGQEPMVAAATAFLDRIEL